MSVLVLKRGKAPSVVPELLNNFADNSWENIIWACATKNVPETWTVGSQKAMTINGTDYLIDIIGKDHDDYADGSGKAPLTFQMHDCYATGYAMNSSATNVGGWTECAMRKTHLPAILALMPAEVQAGIREVSKKTGAGNKSATINTTADKLFLLSQIEIWNSHAMSASGEGSQYAYYAAGDSALKLKKKNGSVVSWFMRSPYLQNNTGFCVNSNSQGYSGFSSASSSAGVAFAFCF